MADRFTHVATASATTVAANGGYSDKCNPERHGWTRRCHGPLILSLDVWLVRPAQKGRLMKTATNPVPAQQEKMVDVEDVFLADGRANNRFN